VADVSLDVAQGEFFGLLGPSGCGKTTTLRMIAGLEKPDSGSIRFQDRDITNLPPERRGFGMVFQNYALFPHLNVFENVAFGLRARHASKAEMNERVQSALELVQLPGYEKRAIDELSGGQQQRVAIARAIAIEPVILLFDEPLSALDRNLRDTLKYSILDLQRRTRKTAIYVTHDQSEAFAISDRIVVMNEGRIEQAGTQLDIYLRPRTEFVANFVGDNNAIAGQVIDVAKVAAGEPRMVDVQAHGMLLRALDPGNVRPGDQVLAFVRPENIDVLADGREPDQPNLIRGRIEQIVFEGPTVRILVDAAGTPIRATAGGVERLTLLDKERRDVVLRLQEVTVVRNDTSAAA
jgi:ABC-type Fe3+/spermidine/putrescine transport system ATPase subunit